jgi:hypothetical protein
MSRPVQISVPAVATAGIAALQTTAGATPLSFAAGTLLDRAATMQNVFRAIMGPGIQRKVSLTSGADIHLINFTIVGVDLQGVAVTEDLAGPTSNTVYSVNEYAVVTSITPDGAVASAVSAGSGNAGSTRWVTCDQYISPNNYTVAITDVVGTIAATVQNTLNDLNAGETATVFAHPTIAAVTANSESNYAYPARFIRAIWTATSGSFIFRLIQAGVAG